MNADQRLVELGLRLPPPQKPQGNYVPFRLAGNLLFLAGVGPQRADGSMMTGKVGAEAGSGAGWTPPGVGCEGGAGGGVGIGCDGGVDGAGVPVATTRPGSTLDD